MQGIIKTILNFCISFVSSNLVSLISGLLFQLLIFWIIHSLQTKVRIVEAMMFEERNPYSKYLIYHIIPILGLSAQDMKFKKKCLNFSGITPFNVLAIIVSWW